MFFVYVTIDWFDEIHLYQVLFWLERKEKDPLFTYKSTSYKTFFCWRIYQTLYAYKTSNQIGHLPFATLQYEQCCFVSFD